MAHKNDHKKGNRTNHINAGRKLAKDPRVNNINVRLNNTEHTDFISLCKDLKLSQANLIVFLLNSYKKGLQ